MLYTRPGSSAADAMAAISSLHTNCRLWCARFTCRAPVSQGLLTENSLKPSYDVSNITMPGHGLLAHTYKADPYPHTQTVGNLLSSTCWRNTAK